MCALLAAQPDTPVVRGRQGGPAPNGDLLGVRQRQRAPERATLCHVLHAVALAYAPRPASVMPTSRDLHKSELQAPGAGHKQAKVASTASGRCKARIKPTQQERAYYSLEVSRGRSLGVPFIWGLFKLVHAILICMSRLSATSLAWKAHRVKVPLCYADEVAAAGNLPYAFIHRSR